MGETPALYDELAEWWPLLSAPQDCADEADEYRRLLEDTVDGPVHEVLELGSGGGNNASHLKRHFRMSLVDRSPGMLAVSRSLNPECEHLEGDMRTIRLSRVFDGVFLHDAVSYLTTREDLGAAMETAAAHCRAGGAALFVPDFVRETFFEGTGHGGHDAPDHGMRYLEWRTDPVPADTTYVVDFAYLLRLPGGAMDVRRDHHVCGLFPRATWLALLEGAGFDARVVPLGHGDLVGSEAFIARRPRPKR
ncbi:MAG TPA: class I SAM-dependent methyltransferase [Actinomycetota bacterium]|jgi:SAM-dependent methyltransferase|nr:class I SAM-dependent methyltransferase [Actinomycetota bacterium]